MVKSWSLHSLLPLSLHLYLLTYQGGEEAGGCQVVACTGEEFQSIPGRLLAQTVGKKSSKFSVKPRLIHERSTEGGEGGGEGG